MLKFLFVIGMLTSSLANAQTVSSPARFTVASGFIPIDDGSFHVVVLTNDSVGEMPAPNFCGSNWSFGLIQSQYRSVNHNNALITNPTGCWAASGSDPKISHISFRYMDLQSGVVREFKIDPKRLRRFIYEWRTEKLFPE